MTKAKEVWTIGAILKWTGQYFAEKGVENPRLDAEVLLSNILKKERIYLYVEFDKPLLPQELTSFREAIKKRVAKQPVAYILGYKEFMGLEFKVTPAVLIPRPDTEILVEQALKLLSNYENPRFVDVGTGSGAIAVSIAKLSPTAVTGVAVDISPAALAVAKENAEKLAVSEKLEFVLGNLCEPLKGAKFTALLSNPPYIPNADIASLAPEVKNEPYLALAGGAEGLDCYIELIQQGRHLLIDGGFMMFEVGINQAQSVAEIARQYDDLEIWEIIKDYGGIDRVVVIGKRES